MIGLRLGAWTVALLLTLGGCASNKTPNHAPVEDRGASQVGVSVATATPVSVAAVKQPPRRRECRQAWLLHRQARRHVDPHWAGDGPELARCGPLEQPGKPKSHRSRASVARGPTNRRPGRCDASGHVGFCHAGGHTAEPDGDRRGRGTTGVCRGIGTSQRSGRGGFCTHQQRRRRGLDLADRRHRVDRLRRNPQQGAGHRRQGRRRRARGR